MKKMYTLLLMLQTVSLFSAYKPDGIPPELQKEIEKLITETSTSIVEQRGIRDRWEKEACTVGSIEDPVKRQEGFRVLQQRIHGAIGIAHRQRLFRLTSIDT